MSSDFSENKGLWGYQSRGLTKPLLGRLVDLILYSLSTTACLIPRPHYLERPVRFGPRGPSFASDTTPKSIDREGLGKRRRPLSSFPQDGCCREV